MKRPIVLARHKASVSLEDAFWEGLKDIAKTMRTSLSDLVGSIDTDREHANLSSAIRLFILGHYQKRAASGLVVDNSVRATRTAQPHRAKVQPAPDRFWTRSTSHPSLMPASCSRSIAMTHAASPASPGPFPGRDGSPWIKFKGTLLFSQWLAMSREARL